jgi:hypothetical protein
MIESSVQWNMSSGITAFISVIVSLPKSNVRLIRVLNNWRGSGIELDES